MKLKRIVAVRRPGMEEWMREVLCFNSSLRNN